MPYDKPNIPIKFWAEDDKPREKLLLKGRAALSDAELIAILLRSGTTTLSAVELGRQMLQSVDNNLVSLSKLSVDELTRHKGIGEAKALSIIAALELGARRRLAEVPEKKSIVTSRDAFELLLPNVTNTSFEEFWVLLLNRANQKISVVNISEGGMSATIVDPKKIFKYALEHGAAAIILCHNHPSGQLKPSDADVQLTRKLKDGGRILDLPILDHIIIGDDKYYSFADEGML